MVELAEWAFGVTLGPAVRAALTDGAASGSEDGTDPFEQEVVLGLALGWVALRAEPEAVREALRAGVRDELCAAMDHVSPNDDGRVLHRLREGLTARVAAPPVAVGAGPDGQEGARSSARRQAAHDAQMDAIMRIAGWERIYR